MAMLLLRIIMRFFYLFPMKKNKVVLQSYNGRLYTCSPKYIAEGLLDTKRYEVFYALDKDSDDLLPEGMTRLEYRSFRHFFHLMTAGFVIFNSTGVTGFLPYRKKQVIIQTWHGGYSFKVIGNDFFRDAKSVKKRKMTGDLLTYFLSGSKKATEQHSASMSVAKEKFLNIGLPRNDVMFRNHTSIRSDIRKEFGLSQDTKIVLYAPTYRDTSSKQSINDYSFEPIDDHGIVEALEERFKGKFVFMYKAHHDMIPTNIGKDCINASEHSDIQELMCASDVIISDYSSCMADFALQRKPGFLFTPDIEDYESVHPFSMDPALWPYKIAHSNKELIHIILNYDEKEGSDRIDDFFTRIGNYEEGHAVDSLITIMDKKMQEM